MITHRGTYMVTGRKSYIIQLNINAVTDSKQRLLVTHIRNCWCY